MTASGEETYRQSNFGLSFITLPGRKKEAIQRVYTFCRVLDDVSDEPGPLPEKTQKLKAWRKELALCYSGRPKHPVTKKLLETIEEFGIPQGYFEDLLNGVETDLNVNEFPGFDELSTYCYRVAGAVGLICLPIFGCPEEEGRNYAVNLGTALQLTNIIRDVQEDAGRGRVYIPLDELKRFGYSKDELFNSTYNTAFAALMNYQAERALGFYRKATLAIPKEYRHQLLPAEVMGSIYFSLLRKIRQRRFQVFKNRIQLSKTRKVGLALRTVLMNRMGWDRNMTL